MSTLHPTEDVDDLKDSTTSPTGNARSPPGKGLQSLKEMLSAQGYTSWQVTGNPATLSVVTSDGILAPNMQK